jgi:hypothetical protein
MLASQYLAGGDYRGISPEESVLIVAQDVGGRRGRPRLPQARRSSYLRSLPPLLPGLLPRRTDCRVAIANDTPRGRPDPHGCRQTRSRFALLHGAAPAVHHIFDPRSVLQPCFTRVLLLTESQESAPSRAILEEETSTEIHTTCGLQATRADAHLNGRI